MKDKKITLSTSKRICLAASLSLFALSSSAQSAITLTTDPGTGEWLFSTDEILDTEAGMGTDRVITWNKGTGVQNSFIATFSFTALNGATTVSGTGNIGMSYMNATPSNLVSVGMFLNPDVAFTGSLENFTLTPTSNFGATVFVDTVVPAASPATNSDLTVVFASVPEPTSIALLGFGGMTLLLRRKRI